MAYASWSVVFGEQPSAAKWNILGTNDASFNDGTGIATGAITSTKISGIDKSLTTTDSNPYKFSAYRAAAHTSSTSDTIISHDSELYDTNNNFTSSTYTAPVDGFYWFSAIAGNTIATGTMMQSYLYVNGSINKMGNAINSPNTSAYGTFSTVTALIQLNATNTVAHYFRGGSGSTVGVGQDRCFFQGFLVCRT